MLGGLEMAEEAREVLVITSVSFATRVWRSVDSPWGYWPGLPAPPKDLRREGSYGSDICAIPLGGGGGGREWFCWCCCGGGVR